MKNSLRKTPSYTRKQKPNLEKHYLFTEKPKPTANQTRENHRSYQLYLLRKKKVIFQILELITICHPRRWFFIPLFLVFSLDFFVNLWFFVFPCIIAFIQLKLLCISVSSLCTVVILVYFVNCLFCSQLNCCWEFLVLGSSTTLYTPLVLYSVSMKSKLKYQQKMQSWSCEFVACNNWVFHFSIAFGNEIFFLLK